MSSKLKKQESVEKMLNILQNYSVVMIVKNNGITVADMKQFRAKLYGISSGAFFIKNKLLCIAADAVHYNSSIKDKLFGANLVIYSNDVLCLLKNVIDFLKDNAKLEVVSCYYESGAISKDAMLELSKMSSIDDLYSKLYMLINMPLVNLYRSTQGVQMKFAHYLKEYKDKNSNI